MRVAMVVGLMLSASSHVLVGQDAPPGWTVFPASPAEAVTGMDVPANAYRFETMAPGWHVTMGPGALIAHDSTVLGGRFVMEMRVFLFPGESNEGYGVAAGVERNGDALTYTAFLVRRDGAASVWRFSGNDRRQLAEWRVDTAVAIQRGRDVVRNDLRVEAEADSVYFSVNNARLVALPRATTAVDGGVGIRIGRAVNAHVSSVDITRKLAPPARRPAS